MPPRNPDDIVLTDEEAAQLRPSLEVMPKAIAAAWRRSRGPQKAPTKQLISLRVDRDVLAAWKATGRGWQSRINAALAAHAPRRQSLRTRSRKNSPHAKAS